MRLSKEQIVKEIVNIRRRLRVIPKGEENLSVMRFEDQLEKSLRRADPNSYIAKKFDYEELMQIKEAYSEL